MSIINHEPMNQDLFKYILRWADNSLIHGQRLAQWCGHGPVLEEDIALTNTALDYIGQATNLYKYAAQIEGAGRDEDQIAFLRDEWEYYNLILLEQPNGDYAYTIARQFLFSTWYYLVLVEMAESKDEFFSGFATKSAKELKYHVVHSRDWVLRMGDGTEESNQRIQTAIDAVWAYLPEMFEMDALDNRMVEHGIGVDFKKIQPLWRTQVEAVLGEATLRTPADGWGHSGGKNGKHSEHLGYILAEMQFLQRAYPGAKW
jgi:ring-1,2-phenylacetyl-CoA epoxidase subunit PaaC